MTFSQKDIGASHLYVALFSRLENADRFDCVLVCVYFY